MLRQVIRWAMPVSVMLSLLLMLLIATNVLRYPMLFALIPPVATWLLLMLVGAMLIRFYPKSYQNIIRSRIKE